MNIWTCGNSLQSWSLNSRSRIRIVNGASVWIIFWIFRRDSNNFLSQLGAMDETWLYHYEPDIKEQSIEWGHSGSPRPAPKIPTAKISYKSSGCLDFLGIKTASSSLIIFQRAKESMRRITHLCWCNSRTFWRIEPAGSSQVGLVLALKCHGSQGTCNPEESGLLGILRVVSWSLVLFSRTGPLELHSFSGLKNQLKFHDYSSFAELIAAAEIWLVWKIFEFFWLSCKS